jgi:hypothetical protein
LIDKHSLYDHLKVQYIKDLNTVEETEKTEQVTAAAAELENKDAV